MGRIVINKCVTNHSGITYNDFKSLGEIILCNEDGNEGIYILNQQHVPIRIGAWTDEITEEIWNELEILAQQELYLTINLEMLSGSVESLSAQTVVIENDVSELSAATDTFINVTVPETYLTIDEGHQLSGSVIQLSGTVQTFSGAIITYVDNRVSSVYRYRGTKNTHDDLPMSGNVTGDTWNVISGYGIVGTVDYVPPGTNWSWDGENWDPLGGIEDLSAYATLDYVDSAITNVHYDISSLSASTVDIDSRKIEDFHLGEFVYDSGNTRHSTQSGANASFEPGGAAMLDLTTLIVDSGRY